MPRRSRRARRGCPRCRESRETTLKDSELRPSPRTKRDAFHWPKYSLIVGTITTTDVNASDAVGRQARADAIELAGIRGERVGRRLEHVRLGQDLAELALAVTVEVDGRPDVGGQRAPDIPSVRLKRFPGLPEDAFRPAASGRTGRRSPDPRRAGAGIEDHVVDGERRRPGDDALDALVERVALVQSVLARAMSFADERGRTVRASGSGVSPAGRSRVAVRDRTELLGEGWSCVCGRGGRLHRRELGCRGGSRRARRTRRRHGRGRASAAARTERNGSVSCKGHLTATNVASGSPAMNIRRPRTGGAPLRAGATGCHGRRRDARTLLTTWYRPNPAVARVGAGAAFRRELAACAGRQVAEPGELLHGFRRLAARRARARRDRSSTGS